MSRELFGAFHIPALRDRNREHVTLDSGARTTAIIALVTVIGGYIRLAASFRADFPSMDGGLFYLMTKELQANHYAIPAFTSYNSVGIPFAYPPLTMYIAGFFSDITGVPLLDFFRLTPGIISTLTIPVFFLLARSITKSNAVGLLSCLVFTLVPNTFIDTVTGGGLTRSAGFLFLIAALYFYHKWILRPNLRDYCLVSICFALAILSHPTPLLYGILAILLIWFCEKRTGKTLIYSAAIFLSTALLTSPWWLVVVNYHGFTPFINAASGRGDLGSNPIAHLLLLDVSGEPYVKVCVVFAMVGTLWCLIKREWLLPSLLFCGLLLYPWHKQDPTIPLAMLAAIGLVAVFQPLWEYTRKPDAAQSAIPRYMFIIRALWIGVILLLNAWAVAQPAATQGETLSTADRAALSWVHDSLPQTSRIMVLSNLPPLDDPLSEWFYPLSGRTSIETYQGREWLPESSNMATWLGLAYSLQDCYMRDIVCLEDWSRKTRLNADYLYLRKPSPGDGEEAIRLMIESLKQKHYAILYDGPGALVSSMSANQY